VSADIHIVPASAPHLVGEVRALFLEYAASLGFDLCLQGFDAEVAALPGDHAPLAGALLLACVGDDVAGCVAMRSFADGIAEMKRLYVRPRYRGNGVGRQLAEAVIGAGQDAGCATMSLDTVPAMVEAITMCRSMGFVEIAAYRMNPVEGAVFMEVEMSGAGEG
jgi:GNAT superfamily N-acetyltransferase